MHPKNIYIVFRGKRLFTDEIPHRPNGPRVAQQKIACAYRQTRGRPEVEGSILEYDEFLLHISKTVFFDSENPAGESGVSALKPPTPVSASQSLKTLPVIVHPGPDQVTRLR